MDWTGLSLLAAFLWASCNVIDKGVLIRWRLDPILLFAILCLSGLIAVLLVWALRGLSPMEPRLIALSLGSGLFFGGIAFCYFYAARDEEITRVVPLLYLSPFYIAVVASIFLAERLSLSNYLGAGLMVLGAFLVSSRKPFSFRHSRAFWLMVLASVFSAGYSLLTKYILLEGGGTWEIFAYSRIGLCVVLFPFLSRSYRGWRNSLRTQGRAPLAWIALARTFSVVAVYLAIWARETGSVTLVDAIVSSQPFFVLLYSFGLGLVNPKLLLEESGAGIALSKALAIACLLLGGYFVR